MGEQPLILKEKQPKEKIGRPREAIGDSTIMVSHPMLTTEIYYEGEQAKAHEAELKEREAGAQ